MKTLLAALFTLLVESHVALAGEGGELIFNVSNLQSAESVTVTITQVSNTYSWSYNNLQQKLIYYSTQYSHTKVATDMIPFAWDCPKGGTDASEGILPWGQMQITIFTTMNHINTSIVNNKSVDFRDENWAWNGVPYPGGDLYIDINATANTSVVRRSGHNLNTDSSEIWGIWGLQDYSPVQSDFKPPIFVTNTINNSIAGGYLHVGTDTYSSGDVALKNYDTLYNIGTNNERFTNSGIISKHNNWNSTPSDYLLARNVAVQATNNVQNAQFDSLRSATLCNSVDGTVVTGTSGGFIPFIDPWYVDSSGNQAGQPVHITSGNSPTGAYGQSSGGVFLNQNPNFLPSQPIYSLQAPVSQTINGHTAFFGG